ncbi:MAG TPA: NAD(P)H-dependent glycerol-3-phosphate dehydrogenase [Candidatus Sulfotelmatobacter sp.]|jgi:glycerol-3-phosphate dehydrogenase (NAD(P)+)
MSKIAIIGAGAWGTALSIVLGRKGTHQVRLWSREKDVYESIRDRHVNDRFLPGCHIPETVHPTTSYEEAIREAEIVVSVMPSHHCRAVFTDLHEHLTSEMLLVSATKGIENQTDMRMTEVIREVVKNNKTFAPRIGALSGPSFALEAARGDPTAITIASEDADLARTIQKEFSDPTFRVYTNADAIGVELGGALKNTIAIAAGICDGLGLGYNSVAALITRGLAEITRLVVACGGKAETMAGLAGLGDLVLTCTGGLSRNRSVGVELGHGRKLPEILASMHGAVAEGVFTTTAALGLARDHGVEMPITEQMYEILQKGKSPRDAIQQLMARSGKSEMFGG